MRACHWDTMFRNRGHCVNISQTKVPHDITQMWISQQSGMKCRLSDPGESVVGGAMGEG